MRPEPVRPSGACSAAAWDFAEVEAVWERWSPLTPYGRDEKERRLVHASAGPVEAARLLAARWEEFAARRAAAGEAATLDRIAWHLRRLPRLPTGFGPGEDGSSLPRDLELTELFELKKFLANHRALLRLLDGEARGAFRIEAACPGLSAELDRGGSEAETFHLSEAYDARLPGLRAAIAGVDASLASLREEARSRARGLTGLDFGGREFLVVPHRGAAALLADRAAFSVEPYDASSYLARLQPSEAEIALEEERDRLVDAERRVEDEVRSRLSAVAAGEAAGLRASAAALRDLDLARSRAVLAAELALVPPRLAPDPEGALLEARGARLVPLEAACAARGLRYAPLDFRLDARACVLFGSNMGGKTVALKTLLACQILAQAALGVPAADFSSAIHPRILYVGESRVGSGPGNPEGGLSGFGFEIRAFAEAWEAAKAGGFAVFDEFARTTGSREAEAILTAAVASLAALPGALSLFSTHFHGIGRTPLASYRRMGGLDREAAARAMGEGTGLAEGIRKINALMDYRVVEDPPGPGSGSDAIAIAALLGLDRGVVALAESHYGGASAPRGSEPAAPPGPP